MTTVGYATLQVIPSMRGVKTNLERELGGIVAPAADAAGAQAGRTLAHRMGEAIKSAPRQLYQSVDRLGGQINKRLGTAFKVGAGVAVGAIATTVGLGLSRLVGIEEAQAKLRGLGHDASAVDQIMGNALDAVRGTAFGLADAATIAAMAVAAGIEPGEALARELKLTADAATIAGVNLDQMGAILGKSAGDARVTMGQLNQLRDSGLGALQMLADHYDVTAAEMEQMVSRGEISGEVLRLVLEDQIGGAALNSGETTLGAFKNMGAAAGRLGAVLAGPVFSKARTFFLGVIDWLDDLTDHVEPLAEAFGVWLAESMEKVGRVFRDRILPVVQSVVGWFQRNAETIGDVARAAVPAIAAIGGIASGLNLARRAMDLFARTGPMLILTALATAFVYAWQNSETFRTVVTAVLEAVGAVASWLWESVLQPVFGFIADAWTFTIGVIQGAWSSILKPVWDAVATSASWLWRSVLSPIFGFIGAAWQATLTAIRTVWNNVLKPVWDAVAAAAQWLWNTILRPIFGTIERVWQATVMAIQIAWAGILRPAWDEVASAARWLWENALRPVFGWIGDRWDTILGGMRTVWNNVLKPVFSAVGDAVGVMRDAVSRAVDAVSRAWDGLKRVFAAPVNWVIDNVLNRFIGWVNGIAERLGLSWRIDVVPNVSTGRSGNASQANRSIGSVPAFNSGGLVPGGGPDRDSLLAALTPGEFVMSRSAVQRYGAANLEAMNDGDVAPIGGPVGWLKSIATSALNVTRRFIVATVRPGFNAAMSLMDSTVGNLGVPGQWVSGATRSIGERILDWAAGIEEEADSRLQLGPGWRSIVDFVAGMGVPHVVTSTDRPGDPGYHGRGKAADFSVGGHGNRGYGSAGLRRIFDVLVEAQDSLAELILAGAPFNIKNGRRVGGYAWGRPGEPGNHWNHVHAAVFDQGGWLPPGLSMVANGTGSPEPVLTRRQWDGIAALEPLARQAVDDRTRDIHLSARIFVGDRELTDIVRVEIDETMADAVPYAVAAARQA